MGKSIINNKRECFICGSQYQLERHHVWHGTGNRRIAEQDGLWVYLCRQHHQKVHGYGGRGTDLTLQRLGELCWLEERGYTEDGIPKDEGIEAFIKRYGKNRI